MSVLDRFESAFERLVEGSVGRVFRSPVQPAEIGRRLERAMSSAEMISVGRRLAPNDYTVEMNPADLDRFAEFLPALERQMADWLEGVVRERGRQTVAPVHVSIVPREQTPRREIRVRAGYAEAPEGEETIMARPAVAVIPRRLRFLNGPQRGHEVLLRGDVVTIGRAPENDVVLMADSVSRHHARIELDEAGARLIDLKSTNGTRLNGRPVATAMVSEGDDIEFGSVLARVAR